MNDYLEFKNYLEHAFTQKDKTDSKKRWYYIPDEKHKNGDDWLKTRYEDRDGHITYNRGSKAGMPTNLKQESSNTKRASERAKFMNQLQQVCRRLQTLHEQLMQTGKDQLHLYENKERVVTVDGQPVKALFTTLKNDGKNGIRTADNELNKLRWKYSKQVDPLEKQLHNLLNAGKNSPLFTDAEKEKMRKWMQEGGTLGEFATVYNDIFGSVAHSELDNYLSHGYEAAMHNKKQSQESVRRQEEDVNGVIQRLKDTAIKDIMFYIKDYNNIIERDRQKIVKAKNMLNSPAGTQAKSSYVKTHSGQPSIREEIKFIEYSMNKNIEQKEELEKELQEIKSDKTGKKAKAYVDGHKHDLHHSSLEEDNMSNEYTEINAYLQHGWFTDLFKSKPNYASTGSRAGMPSNIHLGDSTNPGSKASAIQDELIRMNKKLVEYKSGQEKAKAEYDRYRKLAKDTENRIRDLERSRDAAIKDSVNYKGRQTTVASSAPDKTKLMRTNPIFDAAAAEAAKRLKKRK